VVRKAGRCPLAVALAVRFVPSPVLAECRARAHERASVNSSKFGLMLLRAVWAALAAAGIALNI
jgi:hypothetical protein